MIYWIQKICSILIMQYEVCSKFEYDNMWGCRAKTGWGLSECFLLQFKRVQLPWKGVQILLFDLKVAIFTLNLGVVLLAICVQIAYL